MNEIIKPLSDGLILNVPNGRESEGVDFYVDGGFGDYAPRNETSIHAYNADVNKIAAFIGEANTSVQSLCTSPNIKKWSFRSPYFVKWIDQSNHIWDILPPDGVNEGYDLGRFLGYKHDVEAPSQDLQEILQFVSTPGQHTFEISFSDNDFSPEKLAEDLGINISHVTARVRQWMDSMNFFTNWEEQEKTLDEIRNILEDPKGQYTFPVSVDWGGNEDDYWEIELYYSDFGTKTARLPINHQFTRRLTRIAYNIIWTDVFPHYGEYQGISYENAEITNYDLEINTAGRLSGTIGAILADKVGGGVVYFTGTATIQYRDKFNNFNNNIGTVNITKASDNDIGIFWLNNLPYLGSDVEMRLVSFVPDGIL